MLHPNEELLVPVNVEAKIINYLQEELAKFSFDYTEDIHVALSPPRTRPEEPKNLVTVMANGGADISRSIFQTGVVLTSYSTTNSRTFSLARLAAGLLRIMPIKDADIVHVEVAGQPIIMNEHGSDEQPERFQNFIVRARTVAL